MNPQVAEIRQGSGTIVQIVGDGNRVEAGHPHLSLTRFAARRQIRQDFDRLSPYTRSVPLIGREAQMDSLRTFLDQPANVRVRVATGPGGCGKTRLALELCEQRAAQGWDAGFATGGEMKRFLAQQNLTEWGWRRPTLIVVDYAAQHAEVLGGWIAELAERDAAGEAPPLRLLLLERQANPESGWWREVFESGGYGAAPKRALLDPAQPWTVPPLPDAESRLAVLEALLRSTDPDARLRLDAVDLLPRLATVDWGGDPLSLLMAALTMQRQGQTKVLVARRTDLAQQFARREGDRIGELAARAGLDKVLTLHLAAAATLAQGMPRASFEPFADGERTALRRTDGGDAASLADVLAEALPRADGGIAAVVPDLIGEAFALEFLGGADVSASVLRCAAGAGEPAVAESLVRTAQDYAG